MGSSRNDDTEMREIFQQVDWLSNDSRLTRDERQTMQPRLSMEQLHSSSSRSSRRVPENVVIANEPSNAPVLDSMSTEDQDRTVNRKLRGLHIFMITISGILGIGLYVRSGLILRLGGPAAVLISFTVLGLLAWLVMQCLGEILTIWPISGALIEFVGTFVDEDLGTTVGVLYWLSYSINFAAIILAAAGEVSFWNPGKAIQGTIMFFVVPSFLVILNSFGVQIYGLTEIIGGSLKLIGVLVVIIVMIVINVGVGSGNHIGTKYYKYGPMFPHDPAVANSWVTALFISFSIAAFAYVGVEITAAAALEARIDDQSRNAAPSYEPSERSKNVANRRVSVRFSSTWTAFIVWIIYFVGGLLLTLNLSWDDDRLPQVSGSTTQSNSTSNTDSGFVLSAYSSNIPGLADLVTVITFITALTSANTNLYVASRTLFGLTRKLDGSRWKWLAFFGRTNSYQVPVRAMFLSCFFIWVPFLYLSPSSSTTITDLLDILSQMGSVCCIIVWACECGAYIRFYNCMYLHRNELQEKPQYRHVCRFRRDELDAYPWRSHGQPLTMYAALAGCLFVLLVADGAALWAGFHYTSFISGYLALLVFLGLWLFIKIYRSGGWQFVSWKLEDLSNFNMVMQKIDRLDEIRHRATTKEVDQRKPAWRNLWGIL